jgi:hypothetical protein
VNTGRDNEGVDGKPAAAADLFVPTAAMGSVADVPPGIIIPLVLGAAAAVG